MKWPRSSKLRKIERQVNTLYRKIETKYRDSAVVATNLPDWYTSPRVLSISNISQGTGDDERIGNRVANTSLTLNFTLSPYDSTPEDCHVRALVFWEKNPQNPGSPPPLSEVIAMDGTNLIQDILPPIVPKYSTNFEIIWSKWYVLASNSGAGNIYNRVIKEYIPLKKKITAWGSVTSTDITQNVLWIAFYSDVASAHTPELNMYARLRFQDL